MGKKLLYAIVALLAVSCGKDKPTHQYVKTTHAYAQIPGTDPDKLSLDVYAFPDQTLRPVIFWVHGGGWAIGDKNNQLVTKLNWAYAEGYVFVSVNYRLSETGSGVKFPDHPNDVADALKWTYQHIGDYGGDSSRIGLMGHSAGAHLVALLSVDNSYLIHRHLPLHTIKGTVCLDTEGYDVRHVLTDEPNNSIYRNAFGTDPAGWDAASPQYHVLHGSNVMPPFFMVTRGLNDRVTAAETFRNALQSKSVPVQLINANPYTHERVNDRAGDPDDAKFTPQMTSFYRGIF